MPFPILFILGLGAAAVAAAAVTAVVTSGGGGGDDSSSESSSSGLSGEDTAKGGWTRDRDDNNNGTASYKNERYVGDDWNNREHHFSKQTYDPATGQTSYEEGSMSKQDGKHTT